MKLRIRRTYQPAQVLGDAEILDGSNKLYSFKTIELPWKDNQRRESCIPEGEYRTIRHRSPSYGDCFWLQDVKNRSEILIHVGNFAASKNPRTGTPDTKGCILPGQKFVDIDGDGFVDVTSSGLTMKKLLDTLPNSFITEITSNPTL
jgi:hypothetical protein